jgi:hypothetical protein
MSADRLVAFLETDQRPFLGLTSAIGGFIRQCDRTDGKRPA